MNLPLVDHQKIDSKASTELRSSDHCPACHAAFDAVGTVGCLKFRYQLALPLRHCQRCKHRWLQTTKEQDVLIAESYSMAYSGFRFDRYFREVVTAELSNRLSHFLPKEARLLDVGCGNGEFVDVARSLGVQAEGIDISAAAVGMAVERGLPAVAANFLEHPFPNRFHLLTMWDVLEHLRSPADFAQHARELLLPSGGLLIKVPTYGRLNFGLLKAVPDRGPVLLGAPDHMQFFTEKSLWGLLGRSGFQHLYWFEAKDFRRKRPAQSAKQWAARILQYAVGQMARNRNLYVLATIEAVGEDVLKQLKPRRIEHVVGNSRN